MDGDERAAIEQAILAELGESFQLGGLSANSELATNLGVAAAIFNLLGVLALLMGGFIIFNTFRTVVAERRRDIGMLRAWGQSPNHHGHVLMEGLIRGVIRHGAGLAGRLWAVVGRSIGPLLGSMMNLDLGVAGRSCRRWSVAVLRLAWASLCWQG